MNTLFTLCYRFLIPMSLCLASCGYSSSQVLSTRDAGTDSPGPRTPDSGIPDLAVDAAVSVPDPPCAELSSISLTDIPNVSSGADVPFILSGPAGLHLLVEDSQVRHDSHEASLVAIPSPGTNVRHTLTEQEKPEYIYGRDGSIQAPHLLGLFGSTEFDGSSVAVSALQSLSTDRVAYQIDIFAAGILAGHRIELLPELGPETIRGSSVVDSEGHLYYMLYDSTGETSFPELPIYRNLRVYETTVTEPFDPVFPRFRQIDIVGFGVGAEFGLPDLTISPDGEVLVSYVTWEDWPLSLTIQDLDAVPRTSFPGDRLCIGLRDYELVVGDEHFFVMARCGSDALTDQLIIIDRSDVSDRVVVEIAPSTEDAPLPSMALAGSSVVLASPSASEGAIVRVIDSLGTLVAGPVAFHQPDLGSAIGVRLGSESFRSVRMVTLYENFDEDDGVAVVETVSWCPE